MLTSNDLQKKLRAIDGRGYKAYKDIKGSYSFERFTLIIDHVQGDPFAAPSNMRVKVPQESADFPGVTYGSRSREIACRDFLTRAFGRAVKRVCRGERGTGKSGLIDVDTPGQEILQRTSAFIGRDEVELRFVLGLPAFGRKIAGRHAEEMLCGELPEIVKASLLFSALDRDSLYRHIETNEDADALRGMLPEKGLIAFVADGAVLPRRSGIDDRPLTGTEVVPFRSPESMRASFDLPNAGMVTGMGIRRGITLIVGGGYHGKSTLLKAIERGIYNHIPGDGREFVVSDPAAVKIRAEDGRRIEQVNISPFIGKLPFRKDTSAFSSEDASGSTSQAANIIECIEAGGQVLLIDEDTSATNFMIRDHRMQELVAKEQEPITPFIDKVRSLCSDHGVSTLLVIGGSGDYFDVADYVVCMRDYLPYDVTKEAADIAERYKSERKREGGEKFGTVTPRIPRKNSFDPSKGKKSVKVQPRGRHWIQFGNHTIDLSGVEQIVDESQTRTIGGAILYALQFMDNTSTLRQVIDRVMEAIEKSGLDALLQHPDGNYAYVRGIEIAAAVNRLRTLVVRTAR
jgi:predicted ABC-class ATPase